MEQTYIDLNAQISLYDAEGNLQLEKDKEAARAYFLENVNPNTVFFHDLEEKVEYLIENNYWDREVLERYDFSDVKELFKQAYAHKFRFQTLMGALKFYTQYAMKTNDGQRYLERYEDRVVLNALAFSDDLNHAKQIIDEIISGRFQPATPTFLNAGRANSGEPVSCFLLRMEDNMESISRGIQDSLQLSKRGGGVAILLSNIRESGAPIKGIENQSSGVIPVMKLLEDSFSYANQLGQRQGAGAVYLSAHHPDIMRFLDTKRENADEKIRIKTLSLGVVVPDITFELARNNEDMYLFSPYDVERVEGKAFADLSVTENYAKWVDDKNIKKTKINARKFFQTLAEIQFESGYPYIMFEDTSNRGNPVPNVGRITLSNLCSEISQPNQPATYAEDGSFIAKGRDISCNLGSLNVAKMSELTNKNEFSWAVHVAYKFLNNVAEKSNLKCSPSVKNGNELSRAIGLGQMNLHGALIERGMDYDSDEARLFWQRYISDVTACIIEASCNKAWLEQESFNGFNGSRWADGSYMAEMINHVPEGARFNTAYWESLRRAVMDDGLYNQHLQAIPPTGSISYINNATASIHPITSRVETRKEGKIGRIYYPAYGIDEENFSSTKDAYELGYKPLIDMYAISAKFVDQGQSLTLFFKDTATTRDLNKAQIYAHKAGVKSLYYVRLRQAAIEGTEMENCISCQL